MTATYDADELVVDLERRGYTVLPAPIYVRVPGDHLAAHVEGCARVRHSTTVPVPAVEALCAIGRGDGCLRCCPPPDGAR